MPLDGRENESSIIRKVCLSHRFGRIVSDTPLAIESPLTSRRDTVTFHPTDCRVRPQSGSRNESRNEARTFVIRHPGSRHQFGGHRPVSGATGGRGRPHKYSLRRPPRLRHPARRSPAGLTPAVPIHPTPAPPATGREGASPRSTTGQVNRHGPLPAAGRRGRCHGRRPGRTPLPPS